MRPLKCGAAGRRRASRRLRQRTCRIAHRPSGPEIAYAQGVDIDSDDQGGIAQAVALCDDADTIILCLGESAAMSGEAASRAHPGLPGKQLELARP